MANAKVTRLFTEVLAETALNLPAKVTRLFVEVLAETRTLGAATNIPVMIILL
jgi:hypothetical protein